MRKLSFITTICLGLLISSQQVFGYENDPANHQNYRDQARDVTICRYGEVCDLDLARYYDRGRYYDRYYRGSRDRYHNWPYYSRYKYQPECRYNIPTHRRYFRYRRYQVFPRFGPGCRRGYGPYYHRDWDYRQEYDDRRDF